MFLRGSLITGVLFLAGCAQLGMGNTRGDLQVTEVPAEVREDFTMAEFYQQYCDAGGVPVVASREVYPEALLGDDLYLVTCNLLLVACSL